MADDQDSTVESLMEDLTVAQVIYDSLEGEVFEGVEEERAEALQALESVKRMLRASKRQRAAANEPSLPPVDPLAHGPQDGPSASAFEPQDFPAAMSTPVRPSGFVINDIGSRSVPNRKRDFDSANLSAPAGPSKSRRTTPTQHFDPFSSRAYDSNDVDIIDLTGDDDEELTSRFVAEQARAEQRREQERRDHEYARMLSSQQSPIPGPSTLPTGPNAFDRIMGSQLSGHSSQEDQEDDELQFMGAVRGISYPIAANDPQWEDPISLNQSFNVPPPNRMPGSFGPFTPASQLHAQMPMRTHPGAFGNGMPPNFSAGFGQAPPGFPVPGQPFFPGSHSASGMSGQGGSSLADVISKTNNFDYVNGVDGFGAALPEHLTNFLQDAYHDPRMSDKELDDLLQNIRPDMDIPERNRDGTPAGLKRPLYPHQELAVTWMKKMEEGTNKGGILADDMGLGKTISTLALMLARPATSRPKTNLIVAPVALLRQWEEEIQTKTKLSHRLSVFLYHNKKATTEDLLKYDVVLTTYGTIAQELKRLEKYLEDNAGRNIDFNDKTLTLRCPLLHPKKAKFHRIILDEAQCIKNKDTKTAKACTRLQSTHRWCLTGTPMMNGILELYSLLKFLQIKPYSEWEKFRQSFGILFGRNGDAKSVAMKRLRALLKAIMLRRKKNSQLDGKPILKLPEKTEEIVYAQLSSDEHDFYTQLEKKSQVQFSKYLREGSIGKNYSSILVLLLRLRQACCHPHLNLDVDDANTVSEEEMRQLVNDLDTTIVERIRSIDDFECPICYDVVQNPTFFIPCGHDSCGECLCRLTENAQTINLQEGNESNKAKCPVCRGSFDPAKCFTYEIFQKIHMPECVPQLDGEEEEEEDDDDESDSDDYFSDDEVDKKGNLKGFIIADEFESDGEDSKQEIKKPKKKNKGKKKASDIKPSMLKTLRKEANKNRDAFKKYMKYLRKSWMPAAKVTECMELLKKIAETGEKTIIFSQWTLLLDLLEVAMWHEKKLEKPVRYDGSMSASDRSRASKDFRERNDVKVMLVSLRAGNAGLNLTAASRVIIMDPFWNPYIEMQAVDRAYRIGQQKEVKVYRILTKDTVEDRIVALQEKKKDMVEAALDEAESVKIGRLSAGELKFLFNARD